MVTKTRTKTYSLADGSICDTGTNVRTIVTRNPSRHDTGTSRVFVVFSQRSIRVRRIAYEVIVHVTIWRPTGRHIIAERIPEICRLFCSNRLPHPHRVHILIEGDPVRTSRQIGRPNADCRPLPCTDRCRSIIGNKQVPRCTGIICIYCGFDIARDGRIDADLCYGPSLRQSVFRSENFASTTATRRRPSDRRCAKRARVSASSHSYRARASRVLYRCPDAVNHACHNRPDGRGGPAGRRREDGCRDGDIRCLLSEEGSTSVQTRTRRQQHHKDQ